MLNRLEEIKDSLYKYLETELQLFKIEMQRGLENAIIKLIYLFVLLILLFATGIDDGYNAFLGGWQVA